MYFTRADQIVGEITGIYRASRTSVDDAFVAESELVPAISGVVEAPSFNHDFSALYYHRRDAPGVGVYRIYRVTRALPAECQ